MLKTFLTENLFIRDKFAKAMFANPVNSDYVIKYVKALEQKDNIEILSYEVLYPEINTFKNLKDRITVNIAEVKDFFQLDPEMEV